MPNSGGAHDPGALPPAQPGALRLPLGAESLVVLAHALVVLWLFRGALLFGEVLYFRDLSIYYHPNYVFLAGALRQAVWPLWNPTSDAGSPFLVAYPPDLLMVGLLGARAGLRLGPPLHVLVAMCGASALARRLGTGTLGAWFSGVVFGASGYVLSSVNLLSLLQATSLAPWVLVATLGLRQNPSRRAVCALGLLVALQVSTFSAEIALQTFVLGAALAFPRRRRQALAFGAAGVLAALLAAPAVLGAWDLLQRTQRAEGFQPAVALAWSATPTVFAEAVLPRFFGDVHTFSDTGYWGQAFFPEGYPYLLSLYLGVPVLLLAARSGRGQGRMWGFVALGVLVSMGDRGPLGPLLSPLLTWLRAPVKLFFWSTLALSLLAGRGVDRARVPPGRWVLIPGTLLLVLALCLFRWPELPAVALGNVLPELRDPRAAHVIARGWPGRFATTGALALGVGLAQRLPVAAGLLAGAVAAADLLMLNDAINRTTPAGFYELRPAVRSLVHQAQDAAPGRWFSYGAAACAPLRWNPSVALSNSDVSLYSAERQALLPRAHVLDGLEAAYDEDRTGTAPPGSTLDVRERSPARYRQTHQRIRLANTRWLLSFRELPEDLVKARGEAAIAEVLDPLKLYEIRDPLPRAFWVGEYEVVSDRRSLWDRVVRGSFDPRRVVLLESRPERMHTSGTQHDAQGPGTARASDAMGEVAYERLDPHTVRLRAFTPPGFIVVLDGHHRDWSARSATEAVPVLRANFRYWALPTPGGAQEFLVRYRPRWRGPALGLLAVGAAAAVVLGVGPRAQRRQRAPDAPDASAGGTPQPPIRA